MADVPESVEKAFEERAAVEAQIFACQQRIAFLNGYIVAVNDGNVEKPVVKQTSSPPRKKR